MNYEHTFRHHSALPDPVSDVPHKVKEEVSIGNRDNFVHNLDKETEAFNWFHVESLRYCLTQVGCTGRGFHYKSLQMSTVNINNGITRHYAFKIAFYLVRFIGEINFVKYLSCFMLDCFNFYMMRREFPLALSGCLLYPLETVHGYGMSSSVKEMCQLLHQTLTTIEESCGQPEQLPASFITASHWIVSQLLHDLTVHLIS